MRFTKPAQSRFFYVINRALLACLVMLQCNLSQAAPEIEVLHWWSRGGDNVALQVLKDEFIHRGGKWYDVPTNDSITTLNIAVSRMTKSYAPTLKLSTLRGHRTAI